MVALLGLVMSVAFVSCGSPTLQDFADKINKEEYPKDYGDGFVVQKCEIDGDYLVFRGEIVESKAPEGLFLAAELFPEEFMEMSKQMEEMMLKDEGGKKLFKLCKKEKKGMKMVMTGDKCGKSITFFDIPAERLQSMNF